MRTSYITSLLLTFLLFFGLPVQAQKLTVESMELLPTDVTASYSENLRKDNNGNYCGIIKVILPVSGAQFESSYVIDQTKHRPGEYWVWVAPASKLIPGGKKLTVYTDSYAPLEVVFSNYGIEIEPKRVYKLVINVPVSGIQNPDDGQGFIVMTVEPKNATLTIADQRKTLQDGQYSELVPKGSYRYEVTAEGYAPQSGTIVVDDNTQQLAVSLQSTMSTIEVSCATPGAKIYKDNQLLGTAPQTLPLVQGTTHRIEARLEGYRTYKEDVTLGENENRKLEVPALSPLTGSLRVNYMPIGSEVYVDGGKVGTNPGTFRNINVGSHRVEIRKDGFTTASVTATVNENETTDLKGSLAAITDRNNLNTPQNNSSPVKSAKTGIKGQVIWKDGDGAAGTIVLVKGTDIRKVTDADGNFTIECKPGDKLIFQMVGCKDKEMKALDGMVVKLSKKLF